MKCALRHVLWCGLLLLVGFSSAQDTDTVLQSYGLAVERLNEAVNVLPEDGSLSLNALDQAAQTLRTLSRDTSSPSLVAALERTFVRAQTAVQNQSRTDLSVQVAVLKGGLWRLVYESALRAANDGNLSLSRDRLLGIAADMNFGDSSLEVLSNADTFGKLVTAFDTAAALAVQARLAEASAAESDKDTTYLALAEAYANFLPVQDSPRVSASATGSFSQTFQALVRDDQEAFQSGLASLRQTMNDFQSAAETALQSAETVASTPMETPGETEEPAPSSAETPLLNAPAAAEGVAEEATPLPTAPLLDTARADLTSSLAAFGLDDARREDLVNSYVARKFSSVDDAVEVLYADSSRVLSAIETGNQSAAKVQLGNYRATFEQFLAPLLGATATVSADTRRLVEHFEAAPGLRLQDAAVLVDQTDRIARAVAGTSPVEAQNVMLATSLVWSGWTRLLVMIVLGLLAVIPLYLLNLAFGGANRNWRLIGVALFLLLLPIMYEGLTSLLELVASLSGVGALGSLSAYSIFQNTLSQVVWAALSAVAIALAVAGLHGICVQFGLLGKPSTTDTIISSKDTALGRTSANSAVDWDEEF